MSYNDKTDVEAALQQSTPPGLTISIDDVPSATRPPPQAGLQTPTTSPAASPAGVAVAVPASPPANAQTAPAARNVTLQLKPVDPPAPSIAGTLTLPTPAAQTPAATQPGVLTQS